MKDFDLHDLIDAWLLGTISPEDLALLESKIATDPVVAREAQESRLAYTLLLLIRDRKRRLHLEYLDRLSSLQKEHGKRRGRLILAGTAIIIVIMGWTAWYFAPSQLAARYFDGGQSFADSISSGQQRVWDQAMIMAAQRDYKTAESLFLVLSENDNHRIAIAAEWNALICAFAQNGTTPGLKQKIKNITLYGHEPYRESAKRLLRIIRFPLYDWIYGLLMQEGSSFVRPGII
jgi:hypothetical protein